MMSLWIHYTLLYASGETHIILREKSVKKSGCPDLNQTPNDR